MVTFYNAIAGKGKMMKPYIVESIEKDGAIVTRFEPQVLNMQSARKRRLTPCSERSRR